MYERLTPLHSPQNPIDPRTGIGHVHLKTANLSPIYDFYVTLLGWHVVEKMDTALFSGTGGYHHPHSFITWESAGGTPSPSGHTGLYHVAIAYPTRAALADALRRLLEAGWPLEGTSDHGTHEALYLRDPDDNGLELYWDKPEALWPIDDEGRLAFVSQPINIPDLLAQLEQ